MGLELANSHGFVIVRCSTESLPEALAWQFLDVSVALSVVFARGSNSDSSTSRDAWMLASSQTLHENISLVLFYLLLTVSDIWNNRKIFALSQYLHKFHTDFLHIGFCCTRCFLPSAVAVWTSFLHAYKTKVCLCALIIDGMQLKYPNTVKLFLFSVGTFATVFGPYQTPNRVKFT